MMFQSDRFRFLVDRHVPFPLSPSQIRASSLGLSDEDRGVMDVMAMSLEACGELPFEWGPQEQHFASHCSSDELVPYLIYRYKMSVYPVQRIVADFPVYVLIEPASPCNLRCGFCFQVDPTFNKKSFGYMGYMDMDLYRNVVDQCADGGARALTFASRGEPLLHPKLAEMLRYAADKKKFFDIKLNTNGTLLNDAIIHAIFEAGVSIVVLSIDSADPQQYAELRVGANFESVLQNVKRLIEIRRQSYPDSRTEVRVSGVKIRDDQDRDLFSTFWSGIVDTVAMVDAEERWDTYNNSTKELDHPCDYLWERCYVWQDGIVNPCDADYKSLLTPGNIKERSLREIWHGEAYTRLRRAHLAKQRNTYNPCDRCGI
jgi:radical SAM protein with 4Fe4S-binding SPASM domain